jgi:hypothetical protein
MSETKLSDHAIWLQYWERGKFVEWQRVGVARIEIDQLGVVRVYSHQTLGPISGWNGRTCTLPIGEKPQDPDSTPQRPGKDQQ